MNHTFRFGLAAALVGMAAALGYRYLAPSGEGCGGLFGLGPSSAACTDAESWTAFLNVFSIFTLVLTLGFGILATHLYAARDGFVPIGDMFMAVGTAVAVVEVVVFAIFGALLGVAYGITAVSLTLVALNQDRRTSMVVASVMSLLLTTWVVTDTDVLLLGATPCALWVLAALSYLSAQKSGESLAVH